MSSWLLPLSIENNRQAVICLGGLWPTLLKYPGLNKQISHNKTA
jgi:hypothetical protein